MGVLATERISGRRAGKASLGGSGRRRQAMPLAPRGEAALPSMQGLQLDMQQLEEEGGGQDRDGGPGGEQTICQSLCLSCGCFSFVDGEGCLYCDEEEDSLSYEDWEAYSEPEEEKAPSASPATFCGFKKSFLCNLPVPATPARNRQDCSLLSFVLPQKQQLSAEEAERNAEELVAEEERAKKKAEKKRLKKKRQKDRKRQEKRNQELEAQSHARPCAQQMAQCGPSLPVGWASNGKEGAASADAPSVLRPGPPETEGGASQGHSESLTPPGSSMEEELEEELDFSSTFVSKARRKVSSKSLLHRERAQGGKAGRGSNAQPGRMEPQEALKPGLRKTPLEQSMVLADCGNETAKRGCYREAVLLFTEAVKLNPQEYRFFGNRSFCYEKLQCYPEALRDAQLALRLQPGWPKGLFRQGKALMGLKQYADAARTFEELLRMGGFQDDATAQLHRCQLHLLLNSVTPRAAPLPAWNGTAQETRQPWPGGRAEASCSLPGGTVTITPLKTPLPVLPSAQAPAREWFAVWVGNLTPKVTQDTLLHYFQPYGPIDSVRCLPQRFCAFVNYTHREAAEAAYADLQGVEVDGRQLQLQLKHPVHATQPVTKASGSTQQPGKREHAPLAVASAFSRLKGSRAKGTGGSCGSLPQRGRLAKEPQQL
ncbi:tetratricopeptide repeat protein 31 isoform X2 [Paroedura picta]|uniref:tetratricopeptide repeat protein 31 isoform X2 n=1 Tax=Paroedura picta TaxID=143630 RepID=UPI00405602BB